LDFTDTTGELLALGSEGGDNVDNVLLKLIVARWDRRDANHQPSTLKPETQYPKPQTTKSQEMQAILPLFITDF